MPQVCEDVTCVTHSSHMLGLCITNCGGQQNAHFQGLPVDVAEV